LEPSGGPEEAKCETGGNLSEEKISFTTAHSGKITPTQPNFKSDVEITHPTRGEYTRDIRRHFTEGGRFPPCITKEREKSQKKWQPEALGPWSNFFTNRFTGMRRNTRDASGRGKNKWKGGGSLFMEFLNGRRVLQEKKDDKKGGPRQYENINRVVLFFRLITGKG